MLLTPVCWRTTRSGPTHHYQAQVMVERSLARMPESLWHGQALSRVTHSAVARRGIFPVGASCARQFRTHENHRGVRTEVTEVRHVTHPPKATTSRQCRVVRAARNRQRTGNGESLDNASSLEQLPKPQTT